jgi:PilZ domain-containing protein
MGVPSPQISEPSPSAHPAAKRRSPRFPHRLPVDVALGEDPPVPAITGDISRHGALILSSIAVPVDTILWVRNAQTNVWARARVVWNATHPQMGPYHIGVELLGDAPHVWADEHDWP